MSAHAPSRPFLPDDPVTRATAALAVVLFGALSAKLWPEWLHDPDLSHALFMPVVFAYLLHESRAGTARYLPEGSWPLTAVLGFAGLAALVGAGLYAAALGWSSAIVDFSLTVAFCLLGAAVLTSLAGDRLRVVPLNWSSLTAIGLWILCAPIPPGSYTRLTLALQLGVTGSVLHTLHALGIAAHQDGNVIELANASVGIEDACSGIRSLISCVFAALFFSASLVRRPWARAFLVAASVPLALVMNFARSLALTLLTSHGVAIAGLWHDATGYAVLVVTAALLGGVALLLSQAPVRPSEGPGPAGRPGLAPRMIASAFVALGLAGSAFVYVKTRPTRATPSDAPDLLALLPSQAEGWIVSTRHDLYRFEGTLRTDHLDERTYVRRGPEGTDQVTLYVAYWGVGQAPVSIVAMHTPDACWPGTGWDAQPLSEPETRPALETRVLPLAETRLFTNRGFPQYVWFWHLYDRRPLPFQNPHSAVALLRMAWTYGFTREGDQLFVRVSSNRPWKAIANDPLIAAFFARTQRLGL